MSVKIARSKPTIQLVATLLLVVMSIVSSFASHKTVNLEVSYKTVHFAGKAVKAIAVNDKIPGPVLHFKEGDDVTINVYNHLDKGTTIHWHGVLVPWRMDGVQGVTQEAIPPGGVFHYHFTLKQSGTYWYHAHSGLQEQLGLYGAMIIDPIENTLHYDKDFTMVLSDWSNTEPDIIYANLKKEGDFYQPKLPLQASLRQYIADYRNAETPQAKQKIRKAYQMMQKMRMSIYDFSDIAYDAFLLNGHPTSNPWTSKVSVGDTVRLRFIGAGASTVFQVKIAGATMQMVHVQGNDVKPYFVESFTIAPGETYDVLVKINKDMPYIIYVAPNDQSGAVYGALLTQNNQAVDYSTVAPFPTPGPIMMMGHASKTKYDVLKATRVTNNPNIPVQDIKMDLFGFMDRYVWFLNGKPEYEADPIMIENGKRYRITFMNRTMMNHPMHLHGHWMILRNGQGMYDPLVHTIDVPPGATIVADFDADIDGQWYFHCHNLYHMKAGMANIFRYEESVAQVQGLNGNKQIKRFLLNEIDLNGNFVSNDYEGSFRMLFGSDYHKLQINMEDAEVVSNRVEEADVDIFYWHLISQFWAIKGGANYVYRPSQTPYWQPGIGIEGIMPYFIQTDLRAYFHQGSVKFDLNLMRDTLLARNFFFRLGMRSILATKTIEEDSIGSGLSSIQWTFRPYYQINSNIAAYVQYEHTRTFGPLRRILEAEGEPISEDTVSIGINWLF